jgi:hypothetical protein
MIKQYKAVKPDVCVKQFAPTLESGWYATTKEALQNFSSAVTIRPTVESRTDSDQNAMEPLKRRGRPRKELSDGFGTDTD